MADQAAAETARWLKNRALRYLAQREHSRSELRARLLQAIARRHSPHQDVCQAKTPGCFTVQALQAAVDGVLDELQTKDYVSDERFVASRLRTRQARWGSRRIQAELSVHGLALSGDQQQALQQSELARAQAVWSRKFGQAPTEPREHAKQVRFLLTRGFASDVVRQVLRAAGSDEDTEPGEPE